MATSKNTATRAAVTQVAKNAAVVKPVSEKSQALTVVPKRAGFRRAGRAFPDGETVIPLDDLTDEQYEQLTTEPMLVTYLVDLPDEAAAAQA